jgi:transcriptional regulator with XRE-family HTH domain
MNLERSFLHQMARKVRELRLSNNLTQEGLARRADMALPTYRRFETTGEISLRRFYRICAVLGRASEIESILDPAPIRSIRDLEEVPKRKRGRKS